MIKRFLAYMSRNPLAAWMFSVVFLLSFILILFWVFPGRKTPGLFLLIVSGALSPPTMNLVRRFSNEQRREKPVPPEQETVVGVLSLLMSLGSICVLGVVVFGTRLGLVISIDTGLWLLMLFSGSAMLSFAFGYAARHTKVGRWGLTLAVGWLLLLICFAVVGVLLSLWRG